MSISSRKEGEGQVETLAQKIKHFVITQSGYTVDAASVEEIYQAFAAALREEIMINWTATRNTWAQKKPRVLCYLSMEYLPGKILPYQIEKSRAEELIRAVLTRLNRSWDALLECDQDLGLGNGGLGRLMSCFLDSLSTHHYPVYAYGLRYQYGTGEQEIWNGIQIEKADDWLLHADPWMIRKDGDAQVLKYWGHLIPDTSELENFEEVRVIPYDLPISGYCECNNFSVTTLRLWSSKESPSNFQLQRYNAGLIDEALENTSLTDILYPNDQSEKGKHLRLKQEFLLVSASICDILKNHYDVYGDLHCFGDKVRIQINDTHPALVIVELMRQLLKAMPWKDAFETVQACCSYTNHSIVSEALEEWESSYMKDLLPRQFLLLEKINQTLCDQVREKYLQDEERVQRISIFDEGRVRMGHLAVYGSHAVNGVAQLHTEILKEEIFKDFYEMTPQKFLNVTNGVTPRFWLWHANPLLAQFITERIGNRWLLDFREIAQLSSFAQDLASQKRFWEIRQIGKQKLIEELILHNPIRNEHGYIIGHSPVLSTAALFTAQVKRMHEYKRQLMNVLHLVMVYLDLKKNRGSRIPRMAILGGKAASGYTKAKQIIELIEGVAKTVNNDPEAKDWLSIHFLENYRVSSALKILPAIDLSEQISTAGWEASGTGNMKFAMNGALTIGTEDGANIEMRQAIGDSAWPFRFGKTREENKALGKGAGRAVYSQDRLIADAIDAIREGMFGQDAAERSVFRYLCDQLLEEDRFFVLDDLRSYYDTQKKVEELFQNPLGWAELAMQNIAGMGSFSSDESVKIYAEKIWGLVPCPPDLAMLEKVRQEYSEHDRCRIGQ